MKGKIYETIARLYSIKRSLNSTNEIGNVDEKLYMRRTRIPRARAHHRFNRFAIIYIKFLNFFVSSIYILFGMRIIKKI